MEDGEGIGNKKPEKKEPRKKASKTSRNGIGGIPTKRGADKPAAGRKKVPEKKLKEVKELAEAMKKARTIMIVSTKNVPSPQFQKIKKELRGKAEVKVVKKNILIRAVDLTENPEFGALKEHIKSDCAIAFSNEDAFELAAWLADYKSPLAAKQGQVAESDIKIEAGPTNLPPGPAISEFGEAGLKVAVEEGKITIKQPKVIVRAGEKVTPVAASVLQKLDIKPFMIGLNPAVIYDSKTKKVYVGVKIDKKQTLTDLLSCHSKAFGLARARRYYCKETIGYFLAKANAEMNALKKLSPKEEEKAEKIEEKEKPAQEEKKNG